MNVTDNNTKAKKILTEALEYWELQPETLTHTQTYQFVRGTIEKFLNSGEKETALTLAWEYAKETSFSVNPGC